MKMVKISIKTGGNFGVRRTMLVKESNPYYDFYKRNFRVIKEFEVNS